LQRTLYVVHLLNKIKNLLVIYKLDITPINFFPCIFFLFHLKHMLLMEQIKEWLHIMTQNKFYLTMLKHRMRNILKNWDFHSLTWLKCCCSFSLVKLMQNCSKLRHVIISPYNNCYVSYHQKITRWFHVIHNIR